MRLSMGTYNGGQILSTITDNELDGFKITIPSSPCSVPGACFYVAVGVAGMVIWIPYLSSGMAPKHADWRFSLLLLFWQPMSAYMLADAITGREIFIIDGKSLCLKRESAGRCRSPAFDLWTVKNLRPVRGGDVVNGRSRGR